MTIISGSRDRNIAAVHKFAVYWYTGWPKFGPEYEHHWNDILLYTTRMHCRKASRFAFGQKWRIFGTDREGLWDILTASLGMSITIEHTLLCTLVLLYLDKKHKAFNSRHTKKPAAYFLWAPCMCSSGDFVVASKVVFAVGNRGCLVLPNLIVLLEVWWVSG